MSSRRVIRNVTKPKPVIPKPAKPLRRMRFPLRGGALPWACEAPYCDHWGRLGHGIDIRVFGTRTQIDGLTGTILWHTEDGSYLALLSDGRCYRVEDGEFVRLPPF
jgi:hypothetical protein